MRTIWRVGTYLSLLLACQQVADGQTPTENNYKYWLYRDRLKNFMVVGDCNGCSIPAIYRDTYVSSCSYSMLEWSDATQSLGLYISVLAMEYRLLQNSRSDAGQTTKELYYALEAINRLDIKAEGCWDSIMNGNTQVSAKAYRERSLNGFFIRDDVDSSFFNQQYEGRSVWDHLNNSEFKNPDATCKPIIRSGFSMGVNDEHRGPREESIDQVIILLQGLAFVSRFADSSLVYNHMVFSDGEKRIVSEAKAISNRIVGHICSNGWRIKNPVMKECVQGITLKRKCGFAAPGGSDARWLSRGISMSNDEIQYGQTSRKGVKTSCYPHFRLSDACWSLFKHVSLGKEDFKVLSLAAIGNTWGESTQAVLARRALKSDHHYYHLALMNTAFYGTKCAISDSTYTEILNECPFEANAYNYSYNWTNYGGGGRVIYGPNKDHEVWNIELPGLDYMFYFNLYAITHPAYVSKYRQIPAPDVMAYRKQLKSRSAGQKLSVKY